MDKIDRLLGMVQSYAPDADARASCADLVRTMQRDGQTEDEIVLALASLLVDGLRHGNWPWTGKEETR